MHSRHPSRPLPDLSMQRVLTATIQGKKSFSSGYVWWMGPEELLFWCHEQANVGDDFRLRIDWAQGTALLDCTAMVHNIVSRRITSVKEGNALYATFKLVDPADRDTLTTGLLRDNPTLKAHGLGHLPSLLAPSRHKAELRLKRKLGQGGAAAPSAPPGVGRQAVTRRRASAGRLTSPSGKRAVSAAAGGGASQPKTQSPALPGQPTAHCASAAPTPQRLTAERGKHDERSETDELIPVPSVDGANKDFSSSPSGDGGKYMGRATTSGRSLLASKPGSATARLKAMAGRLRKRAGDNQVRVSTEGAPAAGGAAGEAGESEALRITSLVKGPPLAIFLRIDDPAQLRQAAVLTDRCLELNLHREPGLEAGDQVNVLLALPDGSPLELSGQVEVLGARRLRLSVPAPDELLVSTVEAFLRGEAP